MRRGYFREYSKANLTKTSVEALWLLRIAWFRFAASLWPSSLANAARLRHNREARHLTSWRKEVKNG